MSTLGLFLGWWRDKARADAQEKARLRETISRQRETIERLTDRVRELEPRWLRTEHYGDG